MGFPIVEILMPDLDGDLEARLEQWLVPVGVLVDRDKPIARIAVNGVSHRLVCNMQVVIDETMAANGSMILANQPLAKAAAEGHEIPYGRPYARLERIA